ncbi:unnamed protein product [Moneuplotes crassus]|uniref:Uncharacterized protein n=1 Tax=Euplotes crassus TaxID=5936 RepID=A0AAD1UKF4_EUPCR|nr:unnamed protein product [Moneuplotes crassus]
METAGEKVNSLRFSRDYLYLAVGTSLGYRLYTFQPTTLVLKVAVTNGVKLIIPCSNGNIISYIENSSNTECEPEKEARKEYLVIYNHLKNTQVAKLRFSKEVLDIRYMKSTLIIVQSYSVKIVKMDDYKNPTIIKTAENLYGAIGITFCAETKTDESQLIACPGSESDADVFVIDIKDDTRYCFFPGYATYQYVVTALELNSQGTLLASATTEGKNIDIFDVQDRSKLYSFSRGMFPKHIDYLSFQQNDQELIVSSLDGAVHLFYLLTDQEIKEQQEGNTFFKAAFDFAFSKPSEVKFKINREQTEVNFEDNKKCISCKLEKNLIMTVSNSGYLYLGSYKEENEEAIIEEAVDYLSKYPKHTQSYLD